MKVSRRLERRASQEDAKWLYLESGRIKGMSESVAKMADGEMQKQKR